MRISPNYVSAALAILSLGACTTTSVPPSSAHLRSDSVAAADTASIPKPVESNIALPKPKPAGKVETYSVVVNNVKAEDLLFALARDAKLNVDIHPGIAGTVTLNAIDQTLQQLLTRISKQVDMRWELNGPNLAVMPDVPYLRTYPIDYVNMSRETSVSMSVNSQVSSGATGGGSSGGGSGGGGNTSTTKIDNAAKNNFWETLERNLKDVLRETDKILPTGSGEATTEKGGQQSDGGGATGGAAGSRAGGQAGIAANPAASQEEGGTAGPRTTYREAASVIVNPETGVVSVRATSRQHEKVQEFLDSVMDSARRQVMIEATIVQVDLSSGYQQGINWSRIRADGSGFALTPASLSGTQNSATPFTLTAIDRSNPLDLSLAIRLLENFGTVKVLSSPKLSVLNNQTAILKVVENFVYFSVKSDVAAGQSGAAQKSFTTTPQTVSVGLVMSVTPQVSANGSIILNVRPSISSISAFQTDPNPDLTVPNRVPQIQTREIESVMRVENGQVAVLGGLMEERADYKTGRVPGIGRIPLVGELFTQRDNTKTKSELVIFLRPVVVRDPSVDGDYRGLREFLPGPRFNQPPAHSRMLPQADKEGAAR